MTSAKITKAVIKTNDTLLEMLIENRSEKDEKIIISGNIKTSEYSSISFSSYRIVIYWISVNVDLLVNGQLYFSNSIESI